jgi:hypothetical protein
VGKHYPFSTSGFAVERDRCHKLLPKNSGFKILTRQFSKQVRSTAENRLFDAPFSAKGVYPSYHYKRHEWELACPFQSATASLTPEGSAVDSAVDAVCILSLCSAVLLPTPLIPDGEIVVSVRQHVRLSLLPELEGDAQRFEDFFCRPVAEFSSALACCSRVPEQSATLYSASSRNRFLAMAIRLNWLGFEARIRKSPEPRNR